MNLFLSYVIEYVKYFLLIVVLIGLSLGLVWFVKAYTAEFYSIVLVVAPAIMVWASHLSGDETQENS